MGALGDGGAVVTDDDDLAQALRMLRQYGWESKYHVSREQGRNSRLDEMQAALLCLFLEKLDERNRARIEVASLYRAGIVNPKIQLLSWPVEGSYVGHLFVVKTANREDFTRHMRTSGIATDVHYPVPDHKQNIRRMDSLSWSLPITERLSREVVSLPCFPELNDGEISQVIEAANSW